MDHFTLSGDEAGWLRNKTGATRLGFAVQLKFLTWRGRFPRMRMELPPDAVEHVAKQVGVATSELGFYDFTSRAAKRHRSHLLQTALVFVNTLMIQDMLADPEWAGRRPHRRGQTRPDPAVLDAHPALRRDPTERGQPPPTRGPHPHRP
ncbi:DUF4158 domain-containing protein [Streptomyces europaeiscabiei]|uniref:DUF4158 domain-containing protein n=1 Tax=Streptomyces europaeiscabiei TaxID=146819 RepID=UPI002E2C1BFC|nr:DUF4158 domain-containing protein [Streptomyces europaeiscabiei]